MARANGTSTLSLRDRIERKSKVGVELYHSKQWGVTLELRGLTLGARAALLRGAYENTPKGSVVVGEKFYPTLLASCVYDPETGAPVWALPNDLDAILSLHPKEVDQIVARINALSGLGDEEDKQRKNDSETENTSSSSTSPESLGRPSRRSSKT